MESNVSLNQIKESIVNNAQEYFKVTGESFNDEFLLLLTDSLIDEYKSKRNYPDYFTDERVESDVIKYFNQKKNYFSMKVLPATIGKIGAEGQSSHSENGISRTWETDSWFSDVVPYCEVL